ncbi:hypothetical protein C8J57DRAFT_1320300 [Mycena rebaudengoi]|nr:hypothetical protein C8J57DRAFT_1320300 [Mycena rebaudengoi]
MGTSFAASRRWRFGAGQQRITTTRGPRRMTARRTATRRTTPTHYTTTRTNPLPVHHPAAPQPAPQHHHHAPPARLPGPAHRAQARANVRHARAPPRRLGRVAPLEEFVVESIDPHQAARDRGGRAFTVEFVRDAPVHRLRSRRATSRAWRKARGCWSLLRVLH